MQNVGWGCVIWGVKHAAAALFIPLPDFNVLSSGFSRESCERIYAAIQKHNQITHTTDFPNVSTVCPTNQSSLTEQIV